MADTSDLTRERSVVEAEVRRIDSWIRELRVAMLTTLGTDGALHSRPMATQQAEFDGELWFFTSDRSPKITELLHDRHVNVSYVDAKRNRYVSLSGQATIVRDRNLIEARWAPSLKAWFPDGPSDPHLALLRVRVDAAQSWHSPSGPVDYALGIARSLFTSEPALPGDNEKIELRRSA